MVFVLVETVDKAIVGIDGERQVHSLVGPRVRGSSPTSFQCGGSLVIAPHKSPLTTLVGLHVELSGVVW